MNKKIREINLLKNNRLDEQNRGKVKNIFYFKKYRYRFCFLLLYGTVLNWSNFIPLFLQAPVIRPGLFTFCTIFPQDAGIRTRAELERWGLTLAPDMLTASAWAALATSAFGFSTEMADMILRVGSEIIWTIKNNLVRNELIITLGTSTIIWVF